MENSRSSIRGRSEPNNILQNECRWLNGENDYYNETEVLRSGSVSGLPTILKLTRHWIFALLSVASILNLPA